MLSSKASAQSFAERNGITAAPITARLPNMRTDDPTSVETLIWRVDGKPACCLYTVHGGGHVIPQPRFRFPRQLGKMSSALNAPRAIIFEPGLAEQNVQTADPHSQTSCRKREPRNGTQCSVMLTF